MMSMDKRKEEEVRIGRAAQLHVESLKLAGIGWVPAHRQGEATVAEASDVEPSLFPPETAPPTEDRRRELEVLRRTVCQCSRCPALVACRTQTVFGVGKFNPDICFVGEGPGADEDAQGEPFVGAAGQLLNRIIAACGMRREDVYICNIVKCRPPGNRTPLPDEAENCRPFLEKQLELVNPRYIVALGSTAARNLLHTSASMSQLRGRFHEYRGIPVLVTYHPAYLLPHRAPDKKKDVWEDMKMLLRRLGRLNEAP
jgi:DNA polymerase